MITSPLLVDVLVRERQSALRQDAASYLSARPAVAPGTFRRLDALLGSVSRISVTSQKFSSQLRGLRGMAARGRADQHVACATC